MSKVRATRQFPAEVMWDTAQHAANGMARKLVSVLEEVVEKIQTEAEQLAETAQKSKAKFLEEVDSMALTPSGTLIPLAFVASVGKFVHLVDAPWKALESVAIESASTVAIAFNDSCQQTFGMAIEPEVGSAVHSVSKFLEKLDSANLDFQNSANNLAEALFKRLDETLQDAVHHLSQFIQQFRRAFTELFDSLSNAVFWAPADAHAAFKPVRLRVVRILWRVRNAGRDTIHPLHLGLSKLAQKAGMPAPVWHPVDIQVLPHRSANTTNGLP